LQPSSLVPAVASLLILVCLFYFADLGVLELVALFFLAFSFLVLFYLLLIFPFWLLKQSSNTVDILLLFLCKLVPSNLYKRLACKGRLPFHLPFFGLRLRYCSK